MKEIDIDEGNIFIKKNQHGSSMYIILRGRIKIDDGENDLAILEEKQIFGQLTALNPTPWSINAYALEDSTLLRLDRDVIYEWMSEYPELSYKVIDYLCKKIRQTEKYF